MRDALETVEKREEHLNRKVDNEIKQAKLFSQQNKKREAIQCLKRKKMYEQQITNLEYAADEAPTRRVLTHGLVAAPCHRRALPSQLRLTARPCPIVCARCLLRRRRAVGKRTT